MRIVVDFPAPFGPRKPVTVPGRTVKRRVAAGGTGTGLLRPRTPAVQDAIVLAMAERVVPWDAGCRWEPNAPHAVLAIGDAGRAVLAVNAHAGDASRDCVVFVWSGTSAAIMGSPNDEALSGHRLYQRGLSSLPWAGQVEHSEWIAKLERQNRVHPRHDAARFAGLVHFILPLKEGTVEVVAENVTVVRRPGPTASAAAALLLQ